MNISKYVSKKGKTTYHVKVRFHGIYKTAAFPNKKLAEDWGRLTEAQIIQGHHFPSSGLHPDEEMHTVNEVISLYLKNVLPDKAASTQTTFGPLLKWWTTVIGTYDINTVKPGLIEDYKYHLLREKKYSPSRVNLYLASLSVVFSWAASPRLDWLKENPFKHVKRLKEEPRKPKLTNMQHNILIHECSQNKSPYLHLYVHLILGTGGRAQEVMQLRWSQIDLKNRTVEFLKTKNKEDRLVPLGPTTYNLLKEHHQEMQMQFLLGSGRHLHLSAFADVPVFLSKMCPGKPIKSVWKSWDKARKLAGLPKFRVHDMRHVYADSVATKGGADIADIQKLLGHKNIRHTLRYRHVDIKDLGAKVAAMEEKTYLKK